MEMGTLLVDEQFLPEAQKLVENAKKSIYIATFKAELTTKPRGRALTNFFEHLFEKSRLGVDVRFIINRIEPRGSIPFSNRYAATALKKHGVKVRCLRLNRICHAKMMIVDEYTAILGSHNLSVKSCHNNFEVSYMLRDIYVIGHLYKIFDRMWETAQKV